MTTRLQKIETQIIDLPTIRPHALSMATMSRQSIVLVKVVFDDGLIGIGEAATIGGLSYGDESPESIKLAIDAYLAPLLVENAVCTPAKAINILNRHIVGNNFAKSAVETALFDASGKRAGLAVSELLGGRLRTHLPVLWTLASGDVNLDIEEAERMIAQGRHNIFKLKIGLNSVEADVAHAAAVKKALGDHAAIRVDVNQAWRETDAICGLAKLAEAGVELVEQPIARSARQGMRRLVAQAPLPVMADEVLRGPEDAFDMAVREAAHVFSVKVAQSGGMLKAKEVAAIANATGIGIYGGTMLEAGVGTAASAHVCATLPNLDWGTELFGPLLLTEEILATPLVYRDFALEVPTGPGLGIELDEDKIDFFKRDDS